MLVSCWGVYKLCPRTACLGGSRKNHYHEQDMRRGEAEYFEKPWVPFLPCSAIAITWALIAQLSISGIALMLGLVLLAVIYYFLYALYRSLQHLHADDDVLSRESKETNEREADETTQWIGR